MIASIDIGTSYSSICILGPDGKARPVDVSTGASMFGSKYSLPSAVFVEDNGNILVGQAAMNSRRHKPQNFHKEFKRNLGEEIPFLLGERSFRPEELYTELFRHMKLRAEKLTGEPIEKAYLTYPASYGAKRREKLCSAAKAAGLFELELVDEPTAAAMCYCAEGYIKDGQTLLVYDFGGGTFDVSLIRYENGKFELLSEPLGLERCGGMDIDYLIAADIREAIERELPGTWDSLQKNPSRFMRFTSQLNELAVKAKHHLSDANSFEEYIEVGMDDVHYQLTLERFNGMIASLVGQTLQTCRRALDEAGVAPSEVSAVLMVGGTSRIPLVQEMARKITGKPALCAADLELAVAQGALMYNVYQESEQKRRETEEKIRQGLETKKKARQELEAQEKAEAEEEWKKILQESKAQNIRRAAEAEERKERQQEAVDAKKRSLSANEYFALGKEAAKRKAWDEAGKHFRKAAIMGHTGAFQELNNLHAVKKGEDLHMKISISLEEVASGCTKEIAVKDSGGTRKVNVAIPAGIESGQVVRLAGQGDIGENGGPRGDLNIEIGVLPHPDFRRDGLDIHCDVQVPYKKAMEGGKIEVPSLETKLYFQIPPGTKNGTVYTIQGKGIPKLNGKNRGNLLVTINVQEPSAEDCYQQARQYDQVHQMEEAVTWYQKAAEQGHTSAAYSLGLCYASGWGVPESYNQAAKWFRIAAEKGHGQAAYMLGTYYEEGKGVPKDKAQAKQWLKKAAELGHRVALRELGNVLETPSLKGPQINLQKSFERGLQAEKNKNWTEASEWYQKAANQGITEAMYLLGSYYEFGRGLTHDDDQSAYWYRRAAEQGHAEAAYKLSEYYRYGIGVKKDQFNAPAKWCRIATERKHGYASILLGQHYKQGWGVERNQNYAQQLAHQGVKWLQEAAGIGSIRAMYYLGLYWENQLGAQIGIEPPARTDKERYANHDKAVEWFHKSANGGDIECICHLAWCYEHSMLVSGDRAQAIAWYQRATELGCAAAKKELARLQNKRSFLGRFGF